MTKPKPDKTLLRSGVYKIWLCDQYHGFALACRTVRVTNRSRNFYMLEPKTMKNHGFGANRTGSIPFFLG